MVLLWLVGMNLCIEGMCLVVHVVVRVAVIVHHRVFLILLLLSLLPYSFLLHLVSDFSKLILVSFP